MLQTQEGATADQTAQRGNSGESAIANTDATKKTSEKLPSESQESALIKSVVRAMRMFPGQA